MYRKMRFKNRREILFRIKNVNILMQEAVERGNGVPDQIMCRPKNLPGKTTHRTLFAYHVTKMFMLAQKCFPFMGLLLTTQTFFGSSRLSSRHKKTFPYARTSSRSLCIRASRKKKTGKCQNVQKQIQTYTRRHMHIHTSCIHAHPHMDTVTHGTHTGTHSPTHVKCRMIAKYRHVQSTDLHTKTYLHIHTPTHTHTHNNGRDRVRNIL